VLAVRTVIALLTAGVLAILPMPGPASAGGPTSALLSVPGGGRTASLYYTDAAYTELAELVGAQGGSPGPVDRSGRDHSRGAGVTVTWLIHDVEPWRVDRIFLQGEGAPWIATQEMGGTGTVLGSPFVWRQPTDGAALTRLLNRLVGPAAGPGDGAAKAAAPAGGDVDTPASPAGAPAEPAPVAPAPVADDAPLDDARWGLGGLLAGLLLAAAWGRLRSTRAGAGDDRRDEPDDDEWQRGAVVDRLAPVSRA
jgi:hypothetical protein